MKDKIIRLLWEYFLTISLIAPVFLMHEFAHDYWIGGVTAYLTVIIMGKARERCKDGNCEV